MDFDVDIVVRMAWVGMPIINVPTHVVYHAGGISHFQMVRDNARLVALHARLVLLGAARGFGVGSAVDGLRRAAGE